MSQQTFTITVNVKELLTEFIPKLAKEYIQMRGEQEELKGTELSLTVDISGRLYSYVIKDGLHFDVKEGGINTPMVRISFPLESMTKFADMKNIDMLISIQKQLTRKNFDLLTELKGKSVFQIKHSDDTISEIAVIFNNAETPRATLRLSMENANLISSGAESPINLFMSGKLKIEGDITIAMRLQSFFVA